MKYIILMTLLCGCAPANQTHIGLDYSRGTYCIGGVTYFKSFRNDPLLALDSDSKIIPCKINDEKMP
jgi:hypothetical protein